MDFDTKTFVKNRFACIRINKSEPVKKVYVKSP